LLIGPSFVTRSRRGRLLVQSRGLRGSVLRLVGRITIKAAWRLGVGRVKDRSMKAWCTFKSVEKGEKRSRRSPLVSSSQACRSITGSSAAPWAALCELRVSPCCPSRLRTPRFIVTRKIESSSFPSTRGRGIKNRYKAFVVFQAISFFLLKHPAKSGYREAGLFFQEYLFPSSLPFHSNRYLYSIHL